MTVPVAFAAGLVAFFSPCVLPLLPVWLAFLGANQVRSHWALLANMLLFVLGFALVFTVLGASATMVGRLLLSYQHILVRLAGLILIAFALQMVGVLTLPFFSSNFRLGISPRKSSLGYFLLGVVLAVGWTPCIGMILASILMLAGSLETVGQGMILLFVFSLGFALPFLFFGLVVGPEPLRRMPRHLGSWIHKGAGAILLLMGLLLFFDRWSWLQGIFIW